MTPADADAAGYVIPVPPGPETVVIEDAVVDRRLRRPLDLLRLFGVLLVIVLVPAAAYSATGTAE